MDSLDSNKIECPFSIQWSIAEKDLSTLKDSFNGVIYSKLFDAYNIPGVKYYLKLYPNGDNDERAGKLWIFFYLELDGNIQQKVKADVTYCIEPADFIKQRSYEYELSKGWGTSICTTSELFDPWQKFIIDGKFTIRCDGILSIDKENGLINDGSQWKNSNLGTNLWGKGNKDFNIIVDGKTLQAHKSVLSACSPVFDGMFNSKKKEATESHLEITDFPYHIVKLALQLCYECNTSMLTMDEKISIFKFFGKYRMQNLKDSMEASLIDDISTSNVCQLANFSLDSNSFKLQDKCLRFLVGSANKKRPVKDLNLLHIHFSMKLLQNMFTVFTESCYF